MSQCYPSEFLKFLQRAKAKKPQLFSSAVAHKDCVDTLGELYIVFSAWTRLEDMRNSSCKWSEADWASQVYVWSYHAFSIVGLIRCVSLGTTFSAVPLASRVP